MITNPNTLLTFDRQLVIVGLHVVVRVMEEFPSPQCSCPPLYSKPQAKILRGIEHSAPDAIKEQLGQACLVPLIQLVQPPSLPYSGIRI